jgi:hypothetical protein
LSLGPSLYNVSQHLRFISVFIAGLSWLFPLDCIAEEVDEHSGITEYEVACMACHGPKGRGNGPLAGKLSKAPADLTQIAKSNGGKFPTARIAEIIDGRAIVAAHGIRDMPVWGERYRAATDESETPSLVDERALSQIRSLVRYLETIQEK